MFKKTPDNLHCGLIFEVVLNRSWVIRSKILGKTHVQIIFLLLYVLLLDSDPFLIGDKKRGEG